MGLKPRKWAPATWVFANRIDIPPLQVAIIDSIAKACHCRMDWDCVFVKVEEEEKEKGGRIKGKERGREGIMVIFLKLYLWNAWKLFSLY